LLAPLAAYAVGVWAARHAAFHSHHALIAAVALIGIVLLGLRLPRVRWAIAALLGTFLMLGVALGNLELPIDADRVDLRLAEGSDRNDVPVRLVGWVRRPPETVGDAERFVLETESVFRGEMVSGGVLATVYRYPEDPPLELRYGTQVEFLARVRHPRNFGNPGAFDRVAWLAEQGVYLTATVRPRAPLLVSRMQRGGWWAGRLWAIRLAARRRLGQLQDRAGYEDGGGAAIVAAMTLGDQRGLDASTRSQFERSGTYHVLVVSGMHVGLLAALAIGLVRATGLSIRIAWAFGAVVAFGYAVLLGAELPVSRAAWMLAAYLAASALYRRRHSLNVIAAVALAFLCWRPDWIADVGFQLSFLSVAAIAGIGGPLIERIVRPRQLALRDLWNADRDLRMPIGIVEERIALRDWIGPLSQILRLPTNWGGRILLAPLRVFWASVSVVLISSTITLVLAAPLAYHFQRLSLASPLSNLAVLPLMTVIAPVGFLALLSGWLPPYQLAVGTANVLGEVAAWAAQYEGLQSAPPPPPMLLMALALVSCVVVAWAIANRPSGVWFAGATAVSFGVVIALHPFPAKVNPGFMELTAIDVGQGEALLLGLPDGSAGLVDAGGFPDFRGQTRPTFDVGERIVSPYLGRRGLKRLSFLAITHADADHVAGAVAVMRRFRPEEIWLPHRVLGGELRPLLKAARHAGVPVRFLEDGESLTLGQVTATASFCRRCPKRNDRSLVLSFEYGQHRFLLTGDIEADGEQYLVRHLAPGPTAVLKIPHHGSRTSTSEALLDLTQPTAALVSAGYQNLYGHPHAEVVERLERRGILLMRTDVAGASTVSSDGERLSISSERQLTFVDF
jgi:competence protein ComEC